LAKARKSVRTAEAYDRTHPAFPAPRLLVGPFDAGKKDDAGTVHRLSNPGKIPLERIEVRTGPYLGEDDIVRLEDVYDRLEK
jgi:hypothetical protein